MKRYNTLIDRFEYTVVGQFFAHTHKDEFLVQRSYKDKHVVGAALVASSLTTYTDHLPSFRIFEYFNSEITNYS